MNIYRNGNCIVTICDDGTKIRYCNGSPITEFPESIDLKITNQCKVGCKYCHESSTPNGVHAEIPVIEQAIAGLPPGVEVAIGGGDVLQHPQLNEILGIIRQRGLIPNMTVHASRLQDTKPYRKFICGLGVSYDGNLIPKLDDKCVVHVIVGIHSIRDAESISQQNNILILGFKNQGRATMLIDSIGASMALWKYWIGRLMRRARNIVSFDTLAIRQLNIKQWLPDTVWRERFMGEDGQFTMFIDAVSRTYSSSSIRERRPMRQFSVREMFQDINTRE